MKVEIKLTGLQIKSLKKARKLSKALEVIEEECGIGPVMIKFQDMFICPWIDANKLNKTGMQKVVRNIIRKIRKKQNRK
jgi:hypothetical protein